MLDQFHHWKEPESILALCRLAVIERPGGPVDGMAALAERFPAAVESGAVLPVDGPRVDFSASELRRILAVRQSVRYQLPDVVARYIERHELYR